MLNYTSDMIPFSLSEKNVLDVGCGGGGQEAYYYGKLKGARITGLDISLSSVLAASEMSKRHKIDFNGLVSLAENLPFRSSSFDFVIAYKLLYHLDDPWEAISEILRVSSRGFTFFEPSESLLAKLVFNLGILREEKRGNLPPFRFEEKKLRAFLTNCGVSHFEIRKILNIPGKLYFGKFGKVTKFLASEASLKVQNRLLGRFGNYLQVLVLK
ncbi:class I SAM-dependent methyltransferase [Chloroflexota bacterium]